MFPVTNLRNSYKARIGASEKVFQHIIKYTLLNEALLVKDSLYPYTETGAIIRGEFDTLIRDLPLDAILKTYFNKGVLKSEYFKYLPEIMNRFYSSNIMFGWNETEECWAVRADYWIKIEPHLNF